MKLNRCATRYGELSYLLTIACARLVQARLNWWKIKTDNHNMNSIALAFIFKGSAHPMCYDRVAVITVVSVIASLAVVPGQTAGSVQSGHS